MTLTTRDFPTGTPLHHFFAWNKGRLRPDRRYKLLRAAGRLPELPAGALQKARGNVDVATHAAVFAALEKQEPQSPTPGRILVIRLSAFGDFIQALGAFAAIRRRHAADQITLLTTGPFADFAAE